MNLTGNKVSWLFVEYFCLLSLFSSILNILNIVHKKCKYYLKLDSFKNVDCREYKDDIIENHNIYGLGKERNIIDYYKMTNLHDRLCILFPYYNEYQNLYI